MATVDEKMAEIEINQASQVKDQLNTDNNSNSNDTKPKLDITFDQYEEESVDEAVKEYIKKRRAQKYPSPFLHPELMFNSEEHFWHSKAVPTDENDAEYKCDGCACCISPTMGHKYGITINFRQRIRRSLFVVCVPAIFLTIATFKDISLSVIIGGALLAMFTLYIGQVLFYVLGATEKKDRMLYRVYSVSDKPYRWANLHTAYLQILYDEESIQSISELSAINGGITKTMLNTLGAYTWCAVTVHFAAQLHANRCVFSWDRADLCELLGTAGIVLISIFELDPFSKAMGTFHYMGVLLAALCPLGYCIQQYYIDDKFIFSVILYIVALSALTCFMMTGWATDEAQIEAKKRWDKKFKTSKFLCFVPRCFKGYSVNTYSKMNIVFEAAAIYLTTAALCLWLIEYNQDCEIGCAGIHQHCR